MANGDVYAKKLRKIPIQMSGSFNMDMSWIALRYLFLWASCILLFLRLTKMLRQNNSFLYAGVTVMDILFGISGLLLFFSGRANMWWLSQCLLNWLAGLVMLADILWPRRR
jgi:hypothetical protein